MVKAIYNQYQIDSTLEEVGYVLYPTSLGQNNFKNLTYNEGSLNIGGMAIPSHLF